MISYSQAMKIVSECAARRASDLPSESLPLVQAVGHVLAESLVSPRPVPSFANAAMDGFALRTADWAGQTAPVVPIAGTVAAGDALPAGEVAQPLAWEIMTGAPIPPGCDAVIRVEDTERVEPLSENRVRLARVPNPGENVRPAGEDFSPGAAVLPAGTRLTSEHVLVLATLGMGHVRVRRRPRIAVISTGPELVELAAEAGSLPPGRIYNATAPFLQVSLQAIGAEVNYFGVVADEPEVFHPLLQSVLRGEPDLVLTTGAVSMGKHDFILPALADAGARVLFHRVAIRPGKPIVMAEWAGQSDRATVFFGLPGNPVSTAVGSRFFVEPYLRGLLGRVPEPCFHAVLSEAVTKPEALRCFLKGKVEAPGRVRALAGQASSLVSPLLRAGVWIVAAEGKAVWEAGETVPVFSVASSVEPGGYLW